ncbi:MAG: nucleotidyltransferase [candidate division NC10 bacterium]|nr:nucleotidyltransferase [candidate division NC10 bacterium]
MSEMEPLIPLLAVLRDLVDWLQTGRVPGVVIGGVAASFLGRPRLTRDVDVLVLLDEGRWEEFLALGARFGFLPRLPNTLTFARQTRVLLVRHEPSGIDVDISSGTLPFEEESIARALLVDVGGFSIPLPTPEDLIIMKAVAHRPRDLADIESVLDTRPKLNLRRVRRWVREFSAALEMPEILTDLETILAQRRHRKR